MPVSAPKYSGFVAVRVPTATVRIRGASSVRALPVHCDTIKTWKRWCCASPIVLAMASSGEDINKSRPSFWESKWETSSTPWDCGAAHPYLKRFLETGEYGRLRQQIAESGVSTDESAPPLKPRSALIPGCGSGYDAVLVGAFANQVTAVDLSGIAVKRMENLAREADLTNVKGVVANFFVTQDWMSQGAPFDFIFDDTFFCAIDPSMRGKWARAMKEVTAPGSILLCSVFPNLQKPDGPPYGVSPQAYRDVLLPNAFKEISVTEIPAELRARAHITADSIDMAAVFVRE
ncbi:putative thiol methyltransferase 2 [Porphyridium purpureum]|uniref:Putative thiol methyltransferase 2 n=1 Tax=Porphyridium purpureum TaxID=35688 RepID=A0A5J4Z4F4_PORPP|nr:putative thiol methyltransferase 2 [Porphyridium purpureum]|eukprot:POR4158..scf295_1